MAVEQERLQDDTEHPEIPRYANFTRPTPPTRQRNGWDVYQQYIADNEADMREMQRWER